MRSGRLVGGVHRLRDKLEPHALVRAAPRRLLPVKVHPVEPVEGAACPRRPPASQFHAPAAPTSRAAPPRRAGPTRRGTAQARAHRRFRGWRSAETLPGHRGSHRPAAPAEPPRFGADQSTGSCGRDGGGAHLDEGGLAVGEGDSGPAGAAVLDELAVVLGGAGAGDRREVGDAAQQEPVAAVERVAHVEALRGRRRGGGEGSAGGLRQQGAAPAVEARASLLRSRATGPSDRAAWWYWRGVTARVLLAGRLDHSMVDMPSTPRGREEGCGSYQQGTCIASGPYMSAQRPDPVSTRSAAMRDRTRRPHRLSVLRLGSQDMKFQT